MRIPPLHVLKNRPFLESFYRPLDLKGPVFIFFFVELPYAGNENGIGNAGPGKAVKSPRDAINFPRMISVIPYFT
jgi:hypothetical protein